MKEDLIEHQLIRRAALDRREPAFSVAPVFDFNTNAGWVGSSSLRGSRGEPRGSATPRAPLRRAMLHQALPKHAACLPRIGLVDARPIGIFDSGAGGLTVLHECLVTMPHEDFVYLGDGARCPYGPRPAGEIRRFAHEIASYLEQSGVKLIGAACNAATSAALPQLQESLAVPIVGVLVPEAHAAVQATRNRRIGLLATEATVASGRYEEIVHALDAGVQVVPGACPRLLAPLQGGVVG